VNEARVALVTGGAVRIGRATVEALAAAGWSVAFSYRTSKDEAGELVASLGARGNAVEAVQADLNEPEDRRRLAADVVERLGRLDALVNNAAVFPRTPVGELDETTYRETLRTNLEAPIFLTLACSEALRASSGAVVNIADIYGFRPLRNFLAYSVSKSGLIAATRALAVELAPAVRVNAVAPGVAEFPDDYGTGTRERLLDRTLLGRPGGADEIARAVLYLLDGTHTTTGQVLVVDGGRSVVW
jgi:pteridine reductase